MIKRGPWHGPPKAMVLTGNPGVRAGDIRGAKVVESLTIIAAADRLSNALRLYAEASLRAGALFAVDPEDAINNLDRTFDGVLAGFHSLYDAMGTCCGLDWHAHGDTLVCLLVRNARHHNAAGLFESWNCRMLKRGGLKKMAGAEFLLVAYTLQGEGGRVSEYYVPWDDFRARLAMPKAESKISNPLALQGILDTDCAFDTIRRKAAAERYPANQVYLNLIPIVMNATTRAFGALRSAGIAPQGYDSDVYANHFTKPLADLCKPTFKALRAPTVSSAKA